jgi:hypothetical protein
MLYRVPFHAVFLLSLSVCAQPAQACSQRPAAKTAASAHKSAAEPKLTPQQERGLRLLQAAQAEAATLQPDTRAFVLMQAAEGYQKVDPSKSDALLKEAFTASLSIVDIAPQADDGREHFCQEMEGCGIKPWLQRDILSRISSLIDVRALLPRAQPQVQREVTESLIFRYVTKKDFERAKALVTSLASQGDYPYEAAMHLILAMPPIATSERVAIFAQALNAYQQQSESTSFGSSGFDGMPGMVMRFWHDVPTAMAVDAINQILGKAKDASAGPDSVRLTLSGDAGTVALSSQYQYRLFQLLPLLQELDRPTAESLLRDNPDVRALLGRFPGGLQAVQPDYELHPPKEGEAPIYSMSVSGADSPPTAINALAVQAQQEIQRKEQQVAAETEADPRQALADAMSLPEVIPSAGLPGAGKSPRAKTLLLIAKKLGKKNPGVTKDALVEMRKSLAQTSLIIQAQGLDEAAEEYLEIGDEDGAVKTVKEALQVAEKLYAKDGETGDPNQVFKGAWPSTNQWRRCVQITARFSPSIAEAIIAGIEDPEISAFEKVYFANSLMGVPRRPMPVGERHKSGGAYASL